MTAFASLSARVNGELSDFFTTFHSSSCKGYMALEKVRRGQIRARTQVAGSDVQARLKHVTTLELYTESIASAAFFAIFMTS